MFLNDNRTNDCKQFTSIDFKLVSKHDSILMSISLAIERFEDWIPCLWHLIPKLSIRLLIPMPVKRY